MVEVKVTRVLFEAGGRAVTTPAKSGPVTIFVT